MSARGRFIAGAACATVATFAAQTTGSGSGARSGPWCRDLTKSARENVYDFDLYTLDGKEKIFTLSKLGRPDRMALAVIGISVKEDPDPVRARRYRRRVHGRARRHFVHLDRRSHARANG